MCSRVCIYFQIVKGGENMTANTGLGSKKMDPQTKHDIQSKGGKATTATSPSQSQEFADKAKEMMPSGATQKQAVGKVKETMTKAGEKTGIKGGAAVMGTAAGVVVGAAVGGLAGAALTSKDAREKLTEFSKSAAEIADKLGAKATEISERADEATSQIAHDVKDLQKKTDRE
jgi:gas vesicle protein